MGLFRQKNLLVRICKKTGWLITGREGQLYWLHANDNSRLHPLVVRCSEQSESVTIQSWLPVRFSLENPPSGLFARLLLRSYDLYYAAWLMNIEQSCEACVGLAARVPRRALDARLFDKICREITDEMESVHRELREKFRYDLRGVMPMDTGSFPTGKAGVPVRRPGNQPPQGRGWMG